MFDGTQCSNLGGAGDAADLGHCLEHANLRQLHIHHQK
jgi:hypothetical protein